MKPVENSERKRLNPLRVRANLFGETKISEFLSTTLGDEEGDEDKDKFRLYCVFLQSML
jgi:hypothetical protein